MFRSYESYSEYWDAYLKAHSRPATRVCHYFATLQGLTLGLAALATGNWLLLPVGIAAGYVIAVSSHFLFEGNYPLVNRPIWGAISDVRMCALALSGRLKPHLVQPGGAVLARSDGS